MLEDYYVKPSTIDRIRASWLAPQIESYPGWLEARGYSRLVVYRRLPLLFHFAEFAQKKGCRDVASWASVRGNTRLTPLVATFRVSFLSVQEGDLFDPVSE